MDANAREAARKVFKRAALTVEKAALKAAHDARHAAQGPFTAAAPDNMPSDSYLNTFEQSVPAAQALFWARFGN